MKNLRKNLPFILGLALVSLSYTTGSLLYNPNCPVNYTGAPKATTPNLGQVRYCTNSGCHQDFALNSGGGSITATGLPVANYTPGKTYNFSVAINHSAADRTIWGFAIKAVNTTDNKVAGTFSTANANTSLKGSTASNNAELSHANAAVTAAASNYTYLNLTWTAPTAPTANEANIRFYIAGNAGNGDGSETGDYIYSTTVDAALTVLPLTLDYFTVNRVNESDVQIQWETLQETNTSKFDIETSDDGLVWTKKNTLNAKGASAQPQLYSWTDRQPSAYNNTVYYRLKMLDKDGSYKYSEVKPIVVNTAGIIVKPSSAQPLQVGQNDIFNIYTSKTENILLTVYTITGTRLYTKNIIVNKGASTIEIPGDVTEKLYGVIFVKFSGKQFEKVIRQLIR